MLSRFTETFRGTLQHFASPILLQWNYCAIVCSLCNMMGDWLSSLLATSDADHTFNLDQSSQLYETKTPGTCRAGKGVQCSHMLLVIAILYPIVFFAVRMGNTHFINKQFIMYICICLSIYIFIYTCSQKRRLLNTVNTYVQEQNKTVTFTLWNCTSGSPAQKMYSSPILHTDTGKKLYALARLNAIKVIVWSSLWQHCVATTATCTRNAWPAGAVRMKWQNIFL